MSDMMDEPQSNHQNTGGGEKTSLPAIPLPRDVSLFDEESVVHVATFHNGIYWKGLAVMAFALFLMMRVFNLGLFLVLVAGIMLGIAYVTKHYLLLILTTRRVLLRTGLVRMDTVQLPIDRIESAEIERTIPGMVMGYGGIVFTGTGSRMMAVPYVADPHIFRQKVDRLIYGERKKGD